jgi:hypothetical protein
MSGGKSGRQAVRSQRDRRIGSTPLRLVEGIQPSGDLIHRAAAERRVRSDLDSARRGSSRLTMIAAIRVEGEARASPFEQLDDAG